MSRGVAITGLLGGALLLAIHAHAAIAETGSAGQAVRRTADEILAVLRQPELPLEDRRKRILEIAEARFDTETISRLALARHWRSFSPDQRAQFADEMKRHILVNYGDRIDRYDQEGLEILGERPEARGDVTVRTRVTGGEANGLAVDYRMRRRDDRWLVIDVVVEGVSVIKSYRAQFQKLLSSGSPDDLIAQLREKNDAAASRSASAPAGEPGEAPVGQAEGDEPPPPVADPTAS